MIRLTLGATTLFSLLLAGSAHATTYNITTNLMTTAVDGACSLVEAITASNNLAAKNECPAGSGDDYINLTGGTYSATETLRINRAVTIYGLGSNVIAAKFNGVASATDLIAVSGASAKLVIDNITLRNDTTEANHYVTGVYVNTEGQLKSSSGLRVTGFTWSGIYGVNAYVELFHARIDHNSNSNPVGVQHGGGIYRSDNVVSDEGHGFRLEYSSVTFNTALGDGGGVYFQENGSGRIAYSTLANNSAARGGGLFINTLSDTGAYFESFHATIARNNATLSGGGIYENHQGSGLTISGGIVANNTVNNNAAAATANLFRQRTGGTSEDMIWGAGVTAASLGCTVGWTCNHNTYGADAKLPTTPIPMGGYYPTMEVLMPLKGSPAIDYGSAPFEEGVIDQRGLSDNIDGDGNGSVARDAGAIERNQIWQAEELSQWFSSSNDLVNIDGGYPAGQLGRILSANATNDYVTYAVPIPEPGVWEVVVKFKQASNGGKFRVGTSSSSGGTYDETGFAEQTSYAASTTYPAPVNLGTRTFTTPGNYWFRFRVTAAGAGGGFNLYQDYVKVRKTD